MTQHEVVTAYLWVSEQSCHGNSWKHSSFAAFGNSSKALRVKSFSTFSTICIPPQLTAMFEEFKLNKYGFDSSWADVFSSFTTNAQTCKCGILCFKNRQFSTHLLMWLPDTVKTLSQLVILFLANVSCCSQIWSCPEWLQQLKYNIWSRDKALLDWVVNRSTFSLFFWR